MINNNGLGLPFVGDVVRSWETPYKAIIITSNINENGFLEETKRQINFKGIIQNNKKNLQISGEGQRAWGHYVLHTTTDLKLNLNDVIIINNMNYRIMGTSRKNNYYGYYRYELTEDYKKIE